MKDARFGLLIVTSALSLVSCSKGPTPGEGLTALQASSLGSVLSSELQNLTAALTDTDFAAGFSAVNAQATGKPECVTASPDPTADADGDGLPDTVTYTYNCQKSGPAGSNSVQGTLKFEDTQTAPAQGAKVTATSLTFSQKDASGNNVLYESRNGTRTASGTTTAISVGNDMTVVRQVSSQTAGTLKNKLQVAFQATAGTITAKSLPAGTLEVSGNASWTQGDLNTDLNVTTVNPLQFDPGCASALKIVGGQLKATLTGSGPKGYLNVTFGACGTEPSIKFFAVP
ncbi:hypothetical protein [Deinococcus cellulosilyticus]|uniref:Lipoprotein n=1 Tax=Deinococcus cellulosilyticus (strain DSM 18568 / NBRC 106333 / KACC 11606 / 5516J-15) TaxID=1223518 RepID=A0A511N352_DEIC1|nr:hypothetical protein [Deinococcus cellulosilyticus]GEM47284.1 hypothetical protein DC3_29190 [Deinococcus cellulosilyticus NBRC 106333 = KACC 11606]